MKITKFEDLLCWQQARLLVNDIYTVTKAGELSKDYGLKNQLQRAVVSAMTNIAEGFSRYHRREFIRFLDIAQSSLWEVNSLLYIVFDQKFLPADTIESLQKKTSEVRALTLGLLQYVDNSVSNPDISEPVTEYRENQPVWDIQEEFVNFEHKTTPTL